jgi:hypothetical protein
MAARSWTPTSYRAQYRRQLGLSTGPLHSALEASAPTPDQLAAYQADSVRLDATVLAAIPRVVSRSQARYELVLDERSSAAGQSAHQRAVYLVDVQRRGAAWRVAAFSIQP